MIPKPVYLELWINKTFVASRAIDPRLFNTPREAQDYYNRLADTLATENDAFIKAILKQSPPDTRVTAFVTIPSAINKPEVVKLQKAA